MSFLSDILRFESGGRNVANTTQGTSSGQAQGFFQITTGTWKEFAQKAGIDLAKYPTPMSAPYTIQAQVAAGIPLNRWDPITLQRLTGAGHKFDANATLGQNLAAQGESFSDFKGGGPNQLVPGTSEVIPPEQLNPSVTAPDTSTTGQPSAADLVKQIDEASKPSLAGLFANALGALHFPGGSAGGEAYFPPQPALSLPVSPISDSPEQIGSRWSSSQSARTPSPLSDLFTVDTIGNASTRGKSVIGAGRLPY